jgi:hypothetical protein
VIAVNPETLLQQLIARRLHEMGAHRGEPLTLNEAFNRLPPGDHVTYEAVRRVWTDGHTNIGPKAVRTIATMLQVDEDVVRRAAGQRPMQGPFELPARADKLNEKERAAVLAVMDAILEAAESSRRQGAPAVAARASSGQDDELEETPRQRRKREKLRREYEASLHPGDQSRHRGEVGRTDTA